MIVISAGDFQKLRDFLHAAQREYPVWDKYLEDLSNELRRARVVPEHKVPRDVITMNSLVRLYDLDLEEEEEYTLVFPEDADVSVNRISVLAPIGTAILGYRIGDTVEWQVPAGLRRLRVEHVLQQSEREPVLPPS
jgi:regulator of nucleoside diphosphate kinase